jgi:hypothetical protein
VTEFWTAPITNAEAFAVILPILAVVAVVLLYRITKSLEEIKTMLDDRLPEENDRRLYRD